MKLATRATILALASLSALALPIRLASYDTGFVDCDAVSEGPNTSAVYHWLNASNSGSDLSGAESDDSDYVHAECDGRTYKLICQDFGFSFPVGFPSGYTVTGVKVRFHGYSTVFYRTESATFRGTVQLLDDTGAETGTSKSTLTNLFLPESGFGVDGERIYGAGSTDMWGLGAGDLDSVVADPDFGCSLWLNYQDTGPVTMYLNSVNIKIFYEDDVTHRQFVTEGTGRARPSRS